MDQHYRDEHLDFIKEKIREIKYALFKAEINSTLQLPSNVIQTLKVESDGTIWFLTSCNNDQAKRIDKNFYAYLDYYKKGTDCRLQLAGKATIIDEPDEDFLLLSNYSKNIAGKLVLVKMKIMQAEYFENKTNNSRSLADKIKQTFYHIFLHNPHRTFDFS